MDKIINDYFRFLEYLEANDLKMDDDGNIVPKNQNILVLKLDDKNE